MLDPRINEVQGKSGVWRATVMTRRALGNDRALALCYGGRRWLPLSRAV